MAHHELDPPALPTPAREQSLPLLLTSAREQNIVVTGGAGFIGSHVVAALLSLGARVVVLDNFSTGLRSNLLSFRDHPSFFLAEVDLVDGLFAALTPIVRQIGPIHRIVHLAAQTTVSRSLSDPLNDLRVNCGATIQILEYARTMQIQKVVLASSSATYGDLDSPSVTEDLARQPISPYGINKLSSEMFLRCYDKIYDLPTVALRFFNVYGPRQYPSSPYSGVISLFVSRALQGKEMTIFGDGLQTRDFVFVEDVVQAILLALLGVVRGGEAYNVGTGQPTTILRLAEIIRDLCKSESPLLHHAPRPGDIRHSLADISRIQRFLTYRPSVSIKDGLAETIAWMTSHAA